MIENVIKRLLYDSFESKKFIFPVDYKEMNKSTKIRKKRPKESSLVKVFPNETFTKLLTL